MYIYYIKISLFAADSSKRTSDWYL